MPCGVANWRTCVAVRFGLANGPRCQCTYTPVKAQAETDTGHADAVVLGRGLIEIWGPFLLRRVWFPVFFSPPGVHSIFG